MCGVVESRPGQPGLTSLYPPPILTSPTPQKKDMGLGSGGNCCQRDCLRLYRESEFLSLSHTLSFPPHLYHSLAFSLPPSFLFRCHSAFTCMYTYIYTYTSMSLCTCTNVLTLSLPLPLPLPLPVSFPPLRRR